MAHAGFTFNDTSIRISRIQSRYGHYYVSDDEEDDDDNEYDDNEENDDDEENDDEEDDDEDYDEKDVQNMTPYGFGPKRCSVCAKQAPTPVIVCNSCEVVFYCGAAHQAIDQPHHVSACVAIMRSRVQLNGEQQALRAHHGDMSLPADVFNTGVGKFWGYSETRSYMRARFAAADKLLKVDTGAAIEKALAHFMDMLRLDKSDSLSVRNIVPGLLLRLEREQQCYDFLKQWALMDHIGVRGANAFEPIDVFCSEDCSLSHLAILTLLKLRLFLDLEQIGQPDYDYDDQISRTPLGSFIRAQLRSRRNVSAMTAVVKHQYLELCKVVNEANPHFWDILVDEEIPPLPNAHSPGTAEEAHLAVHQCRAAWHESEGAIAMVDSDTAQFTLVYGGCLPGTGTGDPHWQGRGRFKKAVNLEKVRATYSGAAIPSKFQPPSQLSHPADLFTPTPRVLAGPCGSSAKTAEEQLLCTPMAPAQTTDGPTLVAAGQSCLLQLTVARITSCLAGSRTRALLATKIGRSRANEPNYGRPSQRYAFGIVKRRACITWLLQRTHLMWLTAPPTASLVGWTTDGERATVDTSRIGIFGSSC